MKRVTHTVKPTPMKFFVWLQGFSCCAVPQLWAEDFSVSATTQKERTDLLMKIELRKEEQFMSLDALRSCYPWPAQEVSAC